MPSFADSFWSDDLSSGLKVLFERLYHGCEQCDLFIQLFASRMQFEVQYGRELYGVHSNIHNLDLVTHSTSSSAANNSNNGAASNNGGSTISTALHDIIDNISQEGDQHLIIASNIEIMVLQPFSKWCDDHRERIKYSEKILFKNLTNFEKSQKFISKLYRDYLHCCRTLEDFKSAHFPQKDNLDRVLTKFENLKKFDSHVRKENESRPFATLANIELDFKSMRIFLKSILQNLPKHDFTLPLINYPLKNTNSGNEITKFIMDSFISLQNDPDRAENFGQELINLGFLRYVNGVGTTFVNSKKFQYQWKNYAYTFANEVNNENLPSDEPKENTILAPPELDDNEKELLTLTTKMEESDAKYRKECLKMDSLRCSIEELIIDHLSFMEKCELDRLKGLQKATLDFCSIFSNKISSLKILVDKLVDAESKMDPTADLLSLISTYKTGTFQPKVITYNNYYNPGIYQNFGIDLEVRCHLDGGKLVPLIVSVILQHMDQLYPDLPNDKVRTSVWLAPVKLSLTHELRSLLNKQQFHDDKEILQILVDSKAEPSTVASVLKIYLLELPQPLISNDIYDVLRSLYLKYPPADSQEQNEENRIRGLYTTLSSLSKPHIATLDAISTHFYRLIKILEKGNNGETFAKDFTDKISQEFANCIIQVRIEDGNDLGCKIFHDLLTHKKEIFKVLKKVSR